MDHRAGQIHTAVGGHIAAVPEIDLVPLYEPGKALFDHGVAVINAEDFTYRRRLARKDKIGDPEPPAAFGKTDERPVTIGKA